ncbi:hypothetical protein FMM68_01030 [Lachnospiraceae bacterium MD329]|nr:hypothetical protein [Lachnospiraceae bacterium MD329]
MRSKIFKKLVAGIATLAMAAQFAVVLPVSAATGDTVTILEEALTSGSVTNPTDGSYTWGTEFANDLTAGKGLLLGNKDSKANNYTDKGFVSFSEAKGSATSKLSIAYDVAYQDKSKGQAYNDYTMSYYNADNQFLFSLTESIGSWSDKASITYATGNSTQTAELPSHIGKKVSAEISYDSEGNGYIVIDGGTYQFDSGTNAGVTDIKLTVMGDRDYNRGIYIKNYKMTATEVAALVYRTVAFNVDGKSSSVAVEKGTTIPADNIPATDKKGYLFKGWSTDGSSEYDENKTYISVDELSSMQIEDNMDLTAVYAIDSAYVQKIVKVEFVNPLLSAIGQPDAGATDEYEYQVKVTSDINKDITDNCSFQWEIIGNESDDNYTHLIPDAVAASKAKLTVMSGVSNYYGYIKATVTYDPENSDNENDNQIQTIQIPYAILGNAATSNIIPAGGYPVNMSDYPDSLVGYKATSNDINTRDLVLNNWSIYGSNAARNLELVKYEDGSKGLQFAATGGNHSGSGNTTVGVYQWSAQTAQYTIEAIAKLPSGASIGVYSNTPNNNNAVAECVVKNAGGALEAGTEKIDGISGDAFYKILLTCDPVVKKYCAKVYSEDGKTLIGETEPVAAGTGATMKYLCLYGAFPIDVKSFKVYTDKVESLTVNADKDVIKVPEEGEADAKLTLSANCVGVGGNRILGDVTWSLEDDVEGVSIAGKGQEATLTIKAGASGTVIVRASNGSATNTKEITLTTSSNVVSIKGTSSITIPFAGEADAVGTYVAQTLDKDTQPVEGDEIKYSFTKKDGSTPLDSLPKGIKFDAKTARLTVSAGASPTIIYLKATNKEGLSNKIKINIHGMSFAFGTNEPEEGFTQITASKQYDDKTGYGFEELTGLTDGADKVTGKKFKVKVKVPNGNYVVKVNSTANLIFSEWVSGSAWGVRKTNNEFKVAVCDGILDLTFGVSVRTENKVEYLDEVEASVSTLEISQDTAKTKGIKPAIYSIGDSTTSNAGHPSGYNEATSTDHRTYASWGNCVTAEMYSEDFASYSNKGWAGKNSASYYNLGRLEEILLSVAPGDYVTVNMGINSQGEEPYETLMENYYVNGIIQRGGIPVILTHTAAGPVGKGADGTLGSYTYDEATGKYTFKESREGDGRVQFLKGLAEKYNLNLIDMGKFGNDYYNSLTMDDIDKANVQNKDHANSNYTAPASVLEIVQSWHPDHNHYTKEMGDLYAAYVMSELANIKNNPFAIESVTQTPAEGKITLTATIKEGASTGSQAFGAYVAQYDANNVLVKIEKTDVTFTNDVLTADVPYTKDEQAAAVKVFVWDSNLKPYVTDTAVFPVTD